MVKDDWNSSTKPHRNLRVWLIPWSQTSVLAVSAICVFKVYLDRFRVSTKCLSLRFPTVFILLAIYCSFIFYLGSSLATLENHNSWIQHDSTIPKGIPNRWSISPWSTSIGGHHGSLDKVPKLHPLCHAAKATGQVSLVHSIHAIQNAISVAGKKGGICAKKHHQKV
jgi:hypothetical protein